MESSPQERRRSQRVFLAIPVVLEWTAEDGQRVRIQGDTEQLNAAGALLRLHTPSKIPARIYLYCIPSGQWTRAEAVWFDEPTPDGSIRLAVVLHEPPSVGSLWTE